MNKKEDSVVLPLYEKKYFADEQLCLGGVWTFLGFEGDVPDVNDWFQAALGGHSVFVQRFKEGLRAFENVCPHRFNQIRCESKGHGPVVCGFHHWRFDSKGDAVGIPKCKQYYDKTPKEINARLNVVELSVCGGLIFGRFGKGPSLREWLGPAYDIVNYVTNDLKQCGKLDYAVAAHWKLMMQISLDDYHGVAVHPTTFGREGYLPASSFNYFRFGAHSALIMGGSQIDLKSMSQECKKKKFSLQKNNYIIFQFFPTFVMVLIQPVSLYGDDYCYLLIQHFIPQNRQKTHFHTRFFLMPFNRPAGFVRRLVRKATVPFVNLFFKHYMAKINKEDNRICENIQKVSHQVRADMKLSVQEQRVGWFEEVYTRYVTDKINQNKD